MIGNLDIKFSHEPLRVWDKICTYHTSKVMVQLKSWALAVKVGVPLWTPGPAPRGSREKPGGSWDEWKPSSTSTCLLFHEKHTLESEMKSAQGI